MEAIRVAAKGLTATEAVGENSVSCLNVSAIGGSFIDGPDRHKLKRCLSSLEHDDDVLAAVDIAAIGVLQAVRTGGKYG
jgi:hypothetical protein